MKRMLFSTVLSLTLMNPMTLPAMAAPAAYQVISRDRAVQSEIDIQVSPGRATAIDFSQTNERITYVLLADPSRMVYGANAPIQSGQANTLFLRPIRPLTFPGATTASVTNVSIQTVDQSGQQRLYNFNVRHVDNPQYVGVVISPYQAQQPSPLQPTVSSLNLDSVERGLEIAIRQQYTPADDPIVARVRKMLSLVRGDRLPVLQAANSAQVPVSVLKALERLGTQSNKALEASVVMRQ